MTQYYIEGTLSPCTGMIGTKEVAERVGKGRRAVLHLITVGHLPAVKMGRDWFVEERDLRLIEKHQARSETTQEEKEDILTALQVRRNFELHTSIPTKVGQAESSFRMKIYALGVPWWGS